MPRTGEGRSRIGRDDERAAAGVDATRGRASTARTEVELLPDGVTLDKFILTDKADSAFTGKKAREAFDRLLESVAREIDTRRDSWVAHPVPGF